jgi:gamma-glutamyltranspeptidase/glutathione hydrolase
MSCLPAIFVAILCWLIAAAPARAASLPAVEAEFGMVVSAQRLAAEAGRAMLDQGGNAIDAAVAVGYAEAVTNPCCGNIGGGGFLTARLADGHAIFLNFRETAPGKATPDMFLDPNGAPLAGASLHGWRAVGVPGTVLGLDTALAKYGALSRATVMAPAIRLAREGFVLSRGDANILARAKALRRQSNAAAIFLRRDGSPLQADDRLVQADLARTLQGIADKGPDAFYRGRIPATVEAASRAGGGIIAASDFAAYRIVESAPLSCTYRGFVFLSAPPPSSGGTTLCEMLNILEGYDMRALGVRSARSAHLMVEAMRYAYFDRNTYLGDPTFIANPLERLLSKDYAAAIRARIGDRATLSSELEASKLRVAEGAGEKPETTHFSVLDKDGNAAAVTYTINGAFGAGVIAGDTGFLLNNEMDDFTIKPGAANLSGLVQGAANAIAAGKRPLSSMSPTIVLRDGRVAMVLGSPGGGRIITIVLQTALNMIDHGMTPQEAVDAPRIHHQFLPDTLVAERFALSPDTKTLLEAMGHKIVEQTNWGASALIAVGFGSDALPSSGSDSTATGRLPPKAMYGANDSRRSAGAALGR